MKINIVPLEKIQIDGKSIELGMKKEQVIGILGLGELNNRHFFMIMSLQLIMMKMILSNL